ncbi:acyl-CoA dehydratase activase [bacterium]|nr:acyl-CoA dehydratase activase [bacterium]MCI0607011.1 acyl-CoA dehydratase activase [bacterium]
MEKVIAGIDIGSGQTKAVLLNNNRHLKARFCTKTTANFASVAKLALDSALAQAQLSLHAVEYVATTGLGRYSVSFRDIQITEITCAARGAYELFPAASCVLDMGSQSTRAISLKNGGKVKQFRSNDRCAAGSGGFLEKAAKYLQISLVDIGRLSLHATQPQAISSVCAVLGESEIINHVSNGASIEDILRGIHDSLADRAVSLLKRVGLEGRVVVAGGVARQAGMIRALEEKLETSVYACPRSEYLCAFGAALLGLHRLNKRRNGTYAA